MILKPGSRIAVVAPASKFDPAKLAAGLEIVRQHGFHAEPVGELMAPVRNLAAPDDHRLNHLTDALTHPRWDAVWAVRGGFGVTRLLDRIPWAKITAKPVLGFSDLTPLLDQLRHTPAVGVHGPVLHSLATTDPASVEHLFALLAGRCHTIPGSPWVPGHTVGPVIGGNLSLIAATCGTPYQLDARGAIVVMEEVNEPAYKVDRKLTQARQAGAFTGAVGFVIGQMGGREGRHSTHREVFEDHLCDLGVPVLGEAPIGHGAANRAFVIGARGFIDAQGLTQSLTSSLHQDGPCTSDTLT